MIRSCSRALAMATMLLIADVALADDQAAKAYLARAGGYLQTFNEQGMRLATTMAGASTGQSTLGDIKDAIKRARSVEGAAYVGDYQPLAKSKVPSPYGDIDTRVRDTHRLFDSGTTELLKYWKDEKLAHITTGQAIIKEAIDSSNQAISMVTRAMEDLAYAAATPTPSAESTPARDPNCMYSKDGVVITCRKNGFSIDH